MSNLVRRPVLLNAPFLFHPTSSCSPRPPATSHCLIQSLERTHRPETLVPHYIRLRGCKMNNSTTSLVSTTSTSSGSKPYVCVQTSEHTHANKYKSRISCAVNPILSFQRLRSLGTPKDQKPTLQERERAVQKRESELAQREAKLLSNEEENNKREQRLRSGFLELAQIKVRAACEAAKSKEEKGDVDSNTCRPWWRSRECNGKGWAKWDEGKFADTREGQSGERRSWKRFVGRE